MVTILDEIYNSAH